MCELVQEFIHSHLVYASTKCRTTQMETAFQIRPHHHCYRIRMTGVCDLRHKLSREAVLRMHAQIRHFEEQLVFLERRMGARGVQE